MSTCIKYPRTFHLPYSETVTDDDKRLLTDSHFYQMNSVVCTIKMDGENTTIYPDGSLHARSIDGNKHPWQTWLKRYIQSWCYNIPINWRVCGENLFAKHSIEYTFNTEQEYFQIFGIYNSENFCICWNDLLNFCKNNQLKPVDTFYIGKYDKDRILTEFNRYKEVSEHNNQQVEGFVVRNADQFHYDDFSKNVGKYVRKNHIQTNTHWTQNWTSNIIKKEK